MNCRDFEADVIDLARGVEAEGRRRAELDRHLSTCESCAARFARERQLSTALKEVSESATPSPRAVAIEQELLSAFAARAAEAVRGRTGSRSAVGWLQARPWLAAAAVMVVAVAAWQVVGRWRSPGGPAPAAEAEEMTFVALPTAVGLPPLESGRVVRVALPAASLPAYGFDVAPTSADRLVEADLLVGQDDVARAIRFVSVEVNERSRQ